VIGSSNTVGWGVNDDQTFCAELQRRLPEVISDRPTEALNWAVNGYKMPHKERLLSRYGLGLKPDLVLVDFSDYDLFQPDVVPHKQTTEESVAAAPAEGQPLRIPHEPAPFRLIPEPSWLNRTLRRSRALYCAKNGIYGIKVALGWNQPRAVNEIALLEGKSVPAIEEAWQKVEESLGRIRKLTGDLEGRVGILVFPVREQVTKDYPNEQYQQRLKAVAQRHGFFVVDPLPHFRKHADRVNELFIPYDRGHPGPLGHVVIAEAILEAVRKRSNRLQ
jgi:GDSL-like Lipase/Acylhydrolase family